jgi:hypothetical protein
MARFAPVLLLFAGIAAADDKDAAVMSRLAGAIPPGDLSPDEFLERLDASDVEEHRELFPGARRIRAALYGGRATCFLTAVAHEDRVVEVACSYDLPPELHDKLLSGRKDKPLWTREGDGLRLRWSDGKRKTRFADALAAACGKPEPAEVPADLAAACDLLASPLACFRYGWMEGEGGDPPAARNAIERLLAAKRLDLIRNIARGANPEGRVYAAEALLRSGRALSADEERLVAAVRGMKTPVVCADGCEILEKPAAQALEQGLLHGK